MKYETNYDILYNEIILLFILSFHANFVQVLILLKNISRNYINLLAKCVKKWKETFILLKIVISKFIQYFWYRINSKRMASLENKLTYLPMKNFNRHVIKVIYTESKFLLINLRQTFTKRFHFRCIGNFARIAFTFLYSILHCDRKLVLTESLLAVIV